MLSERDFVDIPVGSTAFLCIPEPFRTNPDRLFCNPHLAAYDGDRVYGLTRRFRIMRTMVTRGQYRSVMGDDGNQFPWVDQFQEEEHGLVIPPGDDAEYPASAVSWDDATGFARRAARATGLPLRLPTELEWEYCAKAGGAAPYFWWNETFRTMNGDAVLDEEVAARYAWFCRNGQRVRECRLRKVGLLLPNQFGLFDMIGLLQEWVADGYDMQRNKPVVRPIDMPARADDWVFAYGAHRVVKGGSVLCGLVGCPAILRLAREADCQDADSGFRLVMDLPS